MPSTYRPFFTEQFGKIYVYPQFFWVWEQGQNIPCHLLRVTASYKPFVHFATFFLLLWYKKTGTRKCLKSVKKSKNPPAV